MKGLVSTIAIRRQSDCLRCFDVLRRVQVANTILRGIR